MYQCTCILVLGDNDCSIVYMYLYYNNYNNTGYIVHLSKHVPMHMYISAW